MKIMDQQTTIDSKSSSTDKKHFPEMPNVMKQFARREESEKNLELSLKAVEDDLFDHGTDKSSQEGEIQDISEIRRKLSGITYEVLYSCHSDSESLSVKKQILDIENSYKSMMEKFLSRMETFLYSCKELRRKLEITVDKFHSLSRYTAYFTLATSSLEILLLAGSSLNKYFHFAPYPSLSILACFVGGAGITATLGVLSYISRSSAAVSNDMRDKNRLFLDLIILHRKGNWIDDQVQKLFPHGIDVQMLQKSEPENSGMFKNKIPWGTYLCFVILLTNMKKDKKLIEDEDFLTTVKLFLRSQAAEMWWSRLKVKKLLDDILKKIEETSLRERVSNHDVHFRQIVSYLYPVMIPLLFNSWNSDRVRIICSILVVIMASHDISSSGCEESKMIKETLNTFDNDFSEIRNICESSDYYD